MRIQTGACLVAAVLLCASSGLAQNAASGALSLKDGRFVFGKPIVKKAGGVEVQFNAAPVFVPDALIRDYFSLATDAAYEPKNDKEIKKVERGLVPFNGVWMTRKRAEQKLEVLQQELLEKLGTQKQAKKWRFHHEDETKHFKFKYNVPDELFERLKDLLGIYHKYFVRYWGKKTKLPFKPTISIYANYDDFLQISGARRGVLGWYHPQNKTLHIFWDRTDPEYTTDVLFHEANHMLADMINGRFRYPHWIEEPMAEYYGASEWDSVKKTMKVGAVQAGRLAEIKNDIGEGKMWSLKQLIHNQSYRSYTWGWSFVHFMMETPAYQKKWKKFYLDLAHREGIPRVVQGPNKAVTPDELEKLLLKYTKHKALETLENEWHAYVAKLDVQSLDGFERAGRKLRTMAGKRSEARRYLEKAVKLGTESAHTFAALADVLGGEGNAVEGVEMINRALKLDPLEAEFYFAKGKLLQKPGGANDEDAAKRCFKLAAEIDPDSWKYAIAEAGG